MGSMRAPHRVRRKKRKDPLEEELEAQQRRDPTATTADKVLQLQRTAGNRAAGAVLARWGGELAQPVDDQQPKWPKTPVAIFDDDLTVAIEAVNEVVGRPNTPRRPGEREPGEDTGGELTIVTASGKHAAELHQAMLRGKVYSKVEIVIPAQGGGIRIVLTDVMISGTQIAGDHYTFSLNFRSRKVERTPPSPR